MSKFNDGCQTNKRPSGRRENVVVGTQLSTNR